VFGLIYPYGIVLQAIAILHFVRRRPETYWLWIILMFGGVGAAKRVAGIRRSMPALGPGLALAEVAVSAFCCLTPSRRLHCCFTGASGR